MPQIKFAAIQLDTIPCEVNHNIHKAMQWTRQAFEQDATYVFLHEGLTADYSPDPIRDGRSLDSWEVYGFSALAKQYDGYVGLGLNEVWQGRPYISMVWLGQEGVIGVYRKSYLWPNRNQHQKDDFNEFLQTYIPYQQGFRLERGVMAPGDGTKVIAVGPLRIGCLICADGSQPEAWETFRKDKPDLIFWQNNRGSLSDREHQQYAAELRTPIVVTNRCGFSYHYYQLGGSSMVADDGTIIVKANEEGKEEMIVADLKELRRL